MLRKVVLVVAVVLLLAGLATTAWAGSERNFIAPLTGEKAGHQTPATGLAIFHLERDGQELHYKLIVADLSNVFMAHIHEAATGKPVVWLYPEAPAVGAPPASWKPGPFSGLLSEGVVTQSNLVGPLAGKSLADLLALLRNNGAYVNVHTNDFVAPTNTGPGDFPGGEIAGTVVQHDAGDDHGQRDVAHDLGDDHGQHGAADDHGQHGAADDHGQHSGMDSRGRHQ